MRTGLIGWTLGLVVLEATTRFVSADDALPAWLDKAIAELQQSRSRDVVEEASYNGRTVYLFTSGSRFDTGDEHVLFSEDGKEICKFGGIGGRVTEGECDLGNINYRRTLYELR